MISRQFGTMQSPPKEREQRRRHKYKKCSLFVIVSGWQAHWSVVVRTKQRRKNGTHTESVIYASVEDVWTRGGRNIAFSENEYFSLHASYAIDFCLTLCTFFFFCIIAHLALQRCPVLAKQSSDRPSAFVWICRQRVYQSWVYNNRCSGDLSRTPMRSFLQADVVRHVVRNRWVWMRGGDALKRDEGDRWKAHFSSSVRKNRSS